MGPKKVYNRPSQKKNGNVKPLSGGGGTMKVEKGRGEKD